MDAEHRRQVVRELAPAAPGAKYGVSRINAEVANLGTNDSSDLPHGERAEIVLGPHDVEGIPLTWTIDFEMAKAFLQTCTISNPRMRHDYGVKIRASHVADWDFKVVDYDNFVRAKIRRPTLLGNSFLNISAPERDWTKSQRSRNRQAMPVMVLHG